MKRVDLTGQKYNLLTVESLERAENGKLVWKCRCECGNTTFVRSSNLRSGAVKSCGCLLKKPPNKQHGESKTKLYRHWISMIYRCSKPENHAYKWYGARGISVCDSWKTYEGFKEWVLKTRPDETYTVERIDVNGDYCPENCTWIPMSEQAMNRTSCVMIAYKGETKNLTEWCKFLGVNYKLVHNRMFKLGWSFEKAISVPLDQSKQNKKRK